MYLGRARTLRYYESNELIEFFAVFYREKCAEKNKIPLFPMVGTPPPVGGCEFTFPGLNFSSSPSFPFLGLEPSFWSCRASRIPLSHTFTHKIRGRDPKIYYTLQDRYTTNFEKPETGYFFFGKTQLFLLCFVCFFPKDFPAFLVLSNF